MGIGFKQTYVVSIDFWQYKVEVEIEVELWNVYRLQANFEIGIGFKQTLKCV